MARMPRKSSVSAPGTRAAIQVLPPSLVCRYVPPVPLAHTTLASTALTPRSDAVELLVCAIHCWASAAAIRRRAVVRRMSLDAQRQGRGLGRHGAGDGVEG